MRITINFLGVFNLINKHPPDGHFSVRSTLGSKYTKVECKFVFTKIFRNEISDKSEFIMKDIANYLEVKDYSNQRKKTSNYLEFTVKTQNIRSNEILINYLTKYPIWSSNFLNYTDWLIAFDLLKKNKNINNKSDDVLNKIKLIKERMYDKRTEFKWNHLQNFYSLNT